MPTRKEIRNKEIAAKRSKTIAIRIAMVEKAKRRRERRKKFMELSAKPIVWIFAIIGFSSTIYWVVMGAVWVINYLSSHWVR